MISSIDQEESSLSETLDQLDLSSEGAWIAIDSGIVDVDQIIGIGELDAVRTDDHGIVELEPIEIIDYNGHATQCCETTAETDAMMNKDDPITVQQENEEEKQCREWLQEQKLLRAKARHAELDRRQAKEQKEKLRIQQMEHAQKREEERVKAASKKGKKGKKAKKI